MTSEPDQFATVAGKAKVAKAVMWDAIGWMCPWAVLVLLLLVIPPLRQSPLWISVGLVGAVVWTGVAIASDVRWLKKYGYTSGLQKYSLRVIDPIDDQILYKARLYEKSIVKLLLGKYEILDLGARRE